MAYIINTGGSSDGITAQDAQTMLAAYQEKLYDSTNVPSGKTANIKTVNNESLLITDSDTDITIGS
jgi:hypothetical protein